MATTSLSRVPPWLRQTVLARGEWKSCTLERSCFGPMHDPTPAVPFHHLAVRLDRAPMRMGWKSDGQRRDTDLPPDHVSIIPAGASVTSWWSRPVDFACLYFTPQAVEVAVGEEILVSSGWELQPLLAVRAPAISRLIGALVKDTQMGQPYGAMMGEAIFQQLAALLVADGRILKDVRYKAGVGDRRVRRALDYIHAHISNELSLEQIAQASETSPFYLTRLFRQTTGYPLWRYVTRLRVQTAKGLMKDRLLTLSDVATLSGFQSYSTFAATFSAELGYSPSYFRRLSEEARS
jgi:AraC family transcriptional regulator